MLKKKQERMEEGLKQERSGVSDNKFSNKRYNEFAELDKKVSAKMTVALGKEAFEGKGEVAKKGNEDESSKVLTREVKQKEAGRDMASLFGAPSDS